MATQLQLRRGTTAENDAFTGAVGELTMDTDTNGLRIHDGSTVGGFDIPTADTADYVVEWQAPTDLNNYTWYRKYKSGWVEQGGEYAGNAKTITLPVVMATNKYQVVINKQSAPSYWATTHLTVGARTTTSFTVSTYGDNASMDVSWQVSGMGA